MTDVTVPFDGITALKEVSMTLAPGEVPGLIGPNGAGKTTLFEVISGLRTPQHGLVELDGTDITRWSPVRRSHPGLRWTFRVVQMFGWLLMLDHVVAALDSESGGRGFLADLVAFPDAAQT
jgi:branched-chain amino acid transport system ATP-binding protein